MLKYSPAVFAVGNTYQIIVMVEAQSLMSVRIGDKIYYDHSNGIMNSISPFHRVTVPQHILENAREYTVCIRPVTERLPYFTKTDEPVEFKFSFKPVPESNIRAYHIADAHNSIDLPVKAAECFGDIDFIILNGDIIDHSGDAEKFANIYEICSRLTNGNIPVVFSRGNHDMRGNYAEKFAELTPNRFGNTYYTFRLGSIWGIVLDCGEDKDDSHAEYGYTVACHDFREAQTDFIHSVIDDSKHEYAADGVKTRLVIAHNPFSMRLEPPFDIEEDIYREWCSLLKENIHPDLMICGHTHKCGIHYAGGEADSYGQPCKLVIGAETRSDNFIGCGFVINGSRIEAVFTGSNGSQSKHTL